ncbi:MAG: radical SAM protein [Candidatus Aminicenantes bacterium]|nr:MAG: radical SAM protein [Candidatus Aminicenantes bacterium]
MGKFPVVYEDGWHPEERDDFTSFRWMKKEAICFLKESGLTGRKYLRISAGHSFPRKDAPILEVFSNGQKIGERKIEPAFSYYVFAFETVGDIRFDFKLNRTFNAPGDARELGIMVRQIEVSTSPDIDTFLDGWYPEEPSSSAAAEHKRWMKKEAKCFLSDLPAEKAKYLKIEGGHPYYGEDNPILTVYAEGEKKGEKEICSGKMGYLFPLDISSDSCLIELELDKVFSPSQTGDPRRLGMMLSSIEILTLDEKSLIYAEGWHEWEHDELFPFRWISQRALAFLPSEKLKANKYLSFYIYSEYANLTQRVNLSLGGKTLCEIPLLHKWNYYSFSIPSFPGAMKDEKGREEEAMRNELTLTLNKVFPKKYHVEDKRELGVRISQIEFHDKDQTHENFHVFHKNALLNYKEMQEGKSKLDSYPSNFGVDLYGKCNIKPPCVYCLWDRMKKLEGDYINVTIDEKTLASYGPFFKSARTLVNCSFGEPLLHPRLKEILDFCQENKKILELSTNGQAFTKRTIDALLGKPIFLYISLDAASKETYAKIRNDRWDSILPNLIYLDQERKKRGNLPKIFMVFMPMKVNKRELEDYFRLSQRIEADSLVLRPLLYLWDPKIEAERGGYHFDYKDELLSREEAEEIFEKCEEYSKKYGVPVANQFNFGTIQEPDSKKDRGTYTEAPRF